VALSGDGLALNVRLYDIVTFLDIFVLSRKNSPFTQPTQPIYIYINATVV
jgi:hypothetical protein